MDGRSLSVMSGWNPDHTNATSADIGLKLEDAVNKMEEDGPTRRMKDSGRCARETTQGGALIGIGIGVQQ